MPNIKLSPYKRVAERYQRLLPDLLSFLNAGLTPASMAHLCRISRPTARRILCRYGYAFDGRYNPPIWVSDTGSGWALPDDWRARQIGGRA